MQHEHRPTCGRAVVGALIVAALSALPAATQAQPAGGTDVRFTTQDASGNAVALNGHLWLPTGAAKGAVVLVHGSGGWSDFREGHRARALGAAGYAALAIDSFGPRGISHTTEDQAQISNLQMTRDAFAARRYLLGRGFPADRIAVMGTSKGGTVALYAADRSFLPEQVDRFAVAIAVSPGCTVRPRVPKPAGALFVALGDKDDYTGVKPCQDIAEAFRNAGGRVTVKVYAGAAHAFDGNPAYTTMVRLPLVENFMNCVAFIEDDGQVSFDGQRYAPDDMTIVAAARKTCVRKGASVWTHPRQKEVVTRDAIDFLNEAFAR